jgi:predicted AAA+ superfamily ATPase
MLTSSSGNTDEADPAKASAPSTEQQTISGDLPLDFPFDLVTPRTPPTTSTRRLVRDIAPQLERWRTNPHRKPLLLSGARQTGKTWSITDFGHRHYESMVSIDFMRDRTAHEFFSGDLDPHIILQNLSIYSHTPIHPHTTLVVFDEIQECPRALTSLKYFCEQAPEYDLIATGSYMGVSRHPSSSFPVGKVDVMTMRPLSFLEFLENSGEPSLASLIREGRFAQISPAFSDRLTSLLRAYLIVGGMPEAVRTYLDSPTDFDAVRSVQRTILDSYELDFSKYADPNQLDRIRLIWHTLPSQLAKDNKKFVYKLLKTGARAREFETGIAWLIDYGAAERVPLVSALRPPLSSYKNGSGFKLFALDTGLLSALANVDPSIIVKGSAVFTEFKGSLAEQYVCQQLVAQGYDLYYWASAEKHVETDFDIEQNGVVHPIEVKSGTVVRSSSPRRAHDTFRTGEVIRTGLTDYRVQDWEINVPLWAIGGLHAYLSTSAKITSNLPDAPGSHHGSAA